MPAWLTTLETNIKANNKTIFTSYTKPTTGSGMAFGEAPPRGALGHWIEIVGGKISNYQLVVPSAWNLGPRCEGNKRSPVESALIGTPVADTAKPLEVLRTVHSFDPCMACAVHVIDTERKEAFEVKAV